MSLDNLLNIDFTKENEALKLLPSKALLSSKKIEGSSIHFDYYRHPPYEIPENCPAQNIILIHTEVFYPTQLKQVINGCSRDGQLKSGDVIIIPANTHHKAYWDKEHSYILLSLDSTILTRNVFGLSNLNNFELLPHFAKPDPLIYGIGVALKTELELNGLDNRLYIDYLTTALSAHLVRRYSAHKQYHLKEYSERVCNHTLQQVIEYINDHLDLNLTLVELAAIAQMSPNSFSRAFKQATGSTPHQYIIECRVERAKQLLLQDKYTISEIAASLGFAHQSHLNRHFKRLVGMTPRAFLSSTTMKP